MAKPPFTRKPLPSEATDPPKASPSPQPTPEPRAPRTISQEPMTFDAATYELTQILRNYRGVNFMVELIEKAGQAEKLLMDKDQALAALEEDIKELTAAKAEMIQREQREASEREANERKRLEDSLASLKAQVMEASRMLGTSQEAMARVEQEARQQTLLIQERGKQNLAEIDRQLQARKSVLSETETAIQQLSKIHDEVKAKYLEEKRAAAAQLQSIKDEISSVRSRVASLG